MASTPAAQRIDAGLQAGAAGIRYGDSVDAAAAVLAPSIRFSTTSVTLGASASLAQLSSGAWSAQGSLGGSLYTRTVASLRGELAVGGAGSDREDGVRTGQLEALARIHVTRGAWGAWLGGGGGRAWDGFSGHTIVLGDAGAWLDRGPLSASMGATPTAIDDSIRYTDVQTAATWRSARLELNASFGVRAGHGLAVVSRGRTWGSASILYWLRPRVGIAGDAGLYPPDLAQGFPNGKYVSLGLRFSLHSAWRTNRESNVHDSRGQSETAAVQAFTVQNNGTRRTIRVRAPAAGLVELASDATDWAPVAMSRDGNGWWTATLTVESGIHQLSLRLDGRDWVVPPGLVSVTDEDGVTTGLWDVK